jgi:uncharacterized protein (UPF0333 family)
MIYLTKKGQGSMRRLLTIGIILIITMIVVLVIYNNIRTGSTDASATIIDKITGWG